MNGRAACRRAAFALGLVAWALGGGGCVSTRESQLPSWWTDPHRHDRQHLYFIAEGQSPYSHEAARQQAREILKEKLAEYVSANLGPAAARDDVWFQAYDTAFADREGQVPGTYYVWLEGRYPVAEYEQIRTRLDRGRKLAEAWGEAQSFAHRRQYGEAERGMKAILGRYDSGLRVPFDAEEVKLALAELYLHQDRGLKARQWIEDVRRSTADSRWRARADELFAQLKPVSVRDAFEGKTVGIYCVALTQGQPHLDPESTRRLGERLATSEIRTMAVRALMHSGGGGMDMETAESVAKTLAPQADVLLALCHEVDRDKTGRQMSIPFTDATAELPDAVLSYWVVRTADGQLLATGSTQGWSRDGVGGMLNAILTHRDHLPKQAPKIAEGLGNVP